MSLIVRAHSFADGVPARPDHINANETVLYTVINGNLDWDNITAALVNAANGFLELDSGGLVPLAQIPATLTGKDADTLDGSELATIIAAIAARTPAGVIVMWSGTLANIPSGWSLCTGAGSTPDLRDKFIRGAASGADPGTTGGSDSITLAEANLPSHTHGAGTLAGASGGAHTHSVNPPSTATSSGGSHTHNMGFAPSTNIDEGSEHVAMYNYSVGYWQAGWIASAGAHTHTVDIASFTSGSGGAHTHTISGSTAAVGSGTGFDNKPAYYALAFIMKD